MEAPQHPAALAEAAHSAKTLLHASVQNAKVQGMASLQLRWVGATDVVNRVSFSIAFCSYFWIFSK